MTLVRTQDCLESSERPERLNAVYRQLFKQNRDLDFFHNSQLDSMFLSGNLTARQLVCQLLSSEMYRDYILGVNSNYHFVSLCFERVLGRPPEQSEKYEWSSFLATQGLQAFAEELTGSDEYMAVFGEDEIPTRRSLKLFSSNQNLPALPKEQSIKRYGMNPYDIAYFGSTLPWEGRMPPRLVRKIGAVFAVAGALEIARIFVEIALSALGTG
ncbi:phycobilisome rod-core linker polypeptide [Roseofilum casamattae]|uniref:Phycobilisome rod-core linker polypeptide n=1 Tax=Roseofilum casamattae BLCC-M143 TaxID=3022442 RepID=A0ABT7BTK5_9CYAN|nr:phycobilisome rod-core linker polypeptide [Roseofilum casamattae]MDJ1182515.1 phycobilisome rod-core linker polypeptide [Roseofilum casamattae BLCC-M143]